jgi:hypothetical protein
MTSKDKVLAVYPEADYLHKRMLGQTFYVITTGHYSSYAIGEGFTESKAWVNAAKNIAEGKQPGNFR